MTDLLKIYKNAIYRIYTSDGDIDLKVGALNDQVDELLKFHNSDFGVFITASNPMSEILDDDINQKNNSLLYSDLKMHSQLILEGVGLDGNPGSIWLDEKSYFALGITRDIAERLAVKYRQKAYVYVAKEMPAELIETKF